MIEWTLLQIREVPRTAAMGIHTFAAGRASFFCVEIARRWDAGVRPSCVSHQGVCCRGGTGSGFLGFAQGTGWMFLCTRACARATRACKIGSVQALGRVNTFAVFGENFVTAAVVA